MNGIKRTYQLDATGSNTSLSDLSPTAKLIVPTSNDCMFSVMTIEDAEDDLVGLVLKQDREYWSLGWSNLTISAGSALVYQGNIK